MSVVYFHSINGTAMLRGAERAHCGLTCSDLGFVMLRVSDFRYEENRILRLLSGCTHCRDARDLGVQFSIGQGSCVLPDGRSEEFFTVGLNTALEIGNDALRLMARVHGQCELHGFVEGKNRAWLARIIAEGLQANLFRADMGWEKVSELLLDSDFDPVVTSFSVCDGFPNPYVAGVECESDDEEAIEAADEAFFALPQSEQWERAMAGLRKSPERLLEWKPDNWETMRFGAGVSALEIRAIADGLSAR